VLAERKAGSGQPRTNAILNSHHARATFVCRAIRRKTIPPAPVWDEEVKRWLAEVVYPDDLS
jgi:hypothetical protein